MARIKAITGSSRSCLAHLASPRAQHCQQELPSNGFVLAVIAFGSAVAGDSPQAPAASQLRGAP
eukprot:CAMPEP_0204134850 /NCGR_PEP_ID=MMETSP0361-20130328/15901_1 /ASSEMBLY_ACC=CAM_ASM_000343 /TAXON_ID=268821 /ORGANISM="Scrippsiella Hangoei, Strain SHTV-5" /LENGTH=63 /DNA_ID=CAMNT_0051088105 /DNA_START=20 /DNA_END=207 /DNA_ORIENTATION=-